MEKTNKELRFKYYATSSEKAADVDKSPYDVAFVGGERKIYTHNVSFGGSELPDMSDYYNKAEVDSIASDLNEDIAAMNASIEDVKSDADEISSDLNTFKGQIREEVDGAISDVQTNITQTSDNKYVAKATLATEVTDIVEGEIGVQTLAAVAVKSDVDEAKSELITRYDNKYDELDSNISAVRTTANSASSKVESVTASGSGGTTIFNQSLLDSQMAGIVADNTSGTNAQIKLIAEGQSSGIDIQAAIDTAVAQATADFTTKTYVDTADGNLATSVTQIRNAVTDSNNNLISSSAIQSKANANEAKLAAIVNWNGDTPVSYKSGLLSSSDMDGAIAGLFASSSTSSAKNNVDTLINSEVSPVSSALANVTSRVTTIEGNYVAESALNAVVDNYGNVTAASVMAAVNGADSSVTIDADRINLNGETWADVIHLDSEFDEYLTAKKVTISDKEITLYEGHDSDEQFTVRLIPTMLTIAANDPTALRDGAVELDAEGLRFLGYLGGTRTGFQYGPEGISYNADSNKQDVIKAILSPEDGTFNSITLNSTVTTTGILSVPGLQIEDSGSGYIDAGPGGLTVHSGGSDLTSASIDTSGIEIQDYPHTVNLYADQVRYDSTSADWPDIIDAANNAIKTSGGNLDVDSITTQGVTMQNETQGNYTGTSLDGTCVLCEQYTDSSKTNTDAVTEITPGMVRLNSYSDAAIVFESGSGSVRITPDGITYNGTTKTWTQIFAAIP